jgi:hypothetical protein
VAAGLSATAGPQEALLQADLAWVRPRGAPARLALRGRWQAGGESLSGGLELLALAGPQPAVPILAGWAAAAPGGEAHAFAAGHAGAVTWRLARRARDGLGLAALSRAAETGLTLEGQAAGGRWRLQLRRADEEKACEEASAPGFPRRRRERERREELGLQWRGAWRLRALWRAEDSSPGARLLSCGRDLAGADCELILFDAPAGGPLAMDGGALARRVEALGGRGWRLAISRHQEAGPATLQVGLLWTQPQEGQARAALWLEGGWCRALHSP